MKTLMLSSLLIIFLTGCNNADETSACTESGFQVPWINTLKTSIKNCTCQTSLIRGSYNNQTVFFITITDPACNFIRTPVLYNCEGEQLKAFTASAADQQDLTDNLRFDRVLYTCER